MKLRAAFAIPGDLASLTGGYAYDREVLARMQAGGVDLRHLALPGGFPFPSQAALDESARLLADVASDEILLCDGLAFGALTRAELDAIRAPVVALVHHPLALETGLAPAQADQLVQSEREALSRARHVIVTSPATRDTLVRDYGVAPDRITIALPGTRPAPRAVGSGSAPHLLAVGSVVPRKGYDILLGALQACRDLDWSLTIAGSLARAPAHVSALQAQLAASGLADRVTLAGEVSDDALETLYARADLFVMSSHYEGYGMVLAEAMARGLPLVATRGGAMDATVPDDAGLKVEPGNAEALGHALRSVIGDADLRRSLAQASFTAGQRLPAWETTAALVAQALAEAAR